MAKIYGQNEDTGVIQFVKPSKEQKAEEKPSVYRLGILGPQAMDLLKIAKHDGFETIAETSQGRLGEETRAIQSYVRLAVTRYIKFRNVNGSEPEN